jgi:peptidoglycan-associated lipoprotein
MMHNFMRYLSLGMAILAISFLPAHAQKKQKDARAQAAYDAGEYFEAIDLYKNAYNKVNDNERKTAILFRIGECYRILGDARSAELWYRKAIREDYQDPIIYLRYGQMMLVNEKYGRSKGRHRDRVL